MSQIKPKARQTKIVVQEFGNEILIYDLRANKSFALNETSSIVWQHCDGKNTIADIAGKMTLELEESVSEELVWLALEKLKKEKLIEDDKNFVTPFKTSSRREVIRRVGMASLVALPIISSLVAPTAVYAFSCPDPNNNASLSANGCACQSNNDCQTTCCGIGFICAGNGMLSSGSPCRVNCECASNMCPAGINTCA